MSNGALVAIETKCQLKTETGAPCGWPAKHLPIGAIPIVGENPSKEFAQLFQALDKHLSKRHADVYQTIAAEMQTFGTFLGLRCFQTQDPKLQQLHISYTAKLRSLAVPPVSDEMIEKAVAQVMLQTLAKKHTAEEIQQISGELEPEIVTMVKRLRDFLTGMVHEPEKSLVTP